MKGPAYHTKDTDHLCHRFQPRLGDSCRRGRPPQPRTTGRDQRTASPNDAFWIQSWPSGCHGEGNIPYDAETAATAAANLAALASLNEDRYWIEGTDASVGGTRAKAEIWSDPEGFAAQLARLGETTAALSAVAGDGLEALQGAFGPVGGTCGSCHEAYRAPRS